MSLASIFLAGFLAAAWVDTPKTDVRSVRFPQTTLSVMRTKGVASIHGPVRVEMSIAKPSVRKPLLRIVCLCVVDGELVWMDGLWDRPKTNAKLSRGDLSAAFRAAGREGQCGEASCISAVMPECASAPYASVTYGEQVNSRGFFRLDRVASEPKILVWRLEVWQNGVLAGVWESARTGVDRSAVPDDWSVRGRYQQKYRYLKSF